MKPKPLLLSKGEESALKRFVRQTRDKGEYRRGMAVLYKAQGLSYRGIARALQTDLKGVFRWVKRFREGGVDGLRTRPKPGRRPRIGDAERRLIAETVLKSPRLFGYLKNNWSLRLLAKHLTKELGIKISNQHLWRILHQLGVVHKRPKAWVQSPDPDFEEKAHKVAGYKRLAPALSKRGSP